MPPGRRGRKGGFAGASIGRGAPIPGPQMLGKRKGPEEAGDDDFSIKQMQ